MKPHHVCIFPALVCFNPAIATGNFLCSNGVTCASAKVLGLVLFIGVYAVAVAFVKLCACARAACLPLGWKQEVAFSVVRCTLLRVGGCGFWLFDAKYAFC
jgi:hypothetical protein